VTARVARFRRIATGLSFLGAGLLTLVGMALTPWEGSDDARAYVQALADHPTRAQVAPLFLHYGFALFAPALFGALALLRGRGATLGHIAAIAAVLGLTSIPGILIIDWYDLALAQRYGVEEAAAFRQTMEESYPLLLLLVVPAGLGFLAALIVLPFALWRAGHAPLWLAIANAVAVLLGEAAPPVLWMMMAAFGVVFLAYAYLGARILRMDDAAWDGAAPAARA